MDHADMHLLIARVNGASASRRSHRYPTRGDLDRAVIRWRAEGFNCFWLYGPADPDGDRPGLGHWVERHQLAA